MKNKKIKLFSLLGTLTTITILSSSLVCQKTQNIPSTIIQTNDELSSVTTASTNALTIDASEVFDGQNITGQLTYVRDYPAVAIKITGNEGFGGKDLTFKSSVAIDDPEQKLKIEIGNAAFKDCLGISGSLKISSGVISLDSHAFAGCSNISSVTFENTYNAFSSIGSFAFAWCNNLSSINFINSDIHNISDSAFAYNSSLTTVDLSQSNIWSIESDAFGSCNSLTEIILPSQLTTIGDYIIQDSKVQSIIIPSTVSSIAAHAFAYAPITKCEVDENSEYYQMTKVSNGYILVSLQDNISGKWNGEQPVGCLAYGQFNLTNYDLTNMYTLVGESKEGPFYGCAGVSSVYLSNQLPDDFIQAFAGCQSLKEVYLPFTTESELEHYKNSFLFTTSPNLKTVYVPKGSENIYEEFKTNLGIEDISIIGTNKFNSNNNLALGLGLGLGLGIPLLVGVIGGTIYGVKKHKSKKA